MNSLTLVLINGLPESELNAFTNSTQIGYNPKIMSNKTLFNILTSDVKKSELTHIVLDPENAESMLLGSRVINFAVNEGVPHIVYISRRFNSHSQDQEVNLEMLDSKLPVNVPVIFNFSGTGIANARSKVKAIDSYIESMTEDDFDSLLVAKAGQSRVTGIKHQKNRLGEDLWRVTEYTDLVSLSKVMID